MGPHEGQRLARVPQLPHPRRNVQGYPDRDGLAPAQGCQGEGRDLHRMSQGHRAQGSERSEEGRRIAMLLDGFGRRVDYLRLSVTDRCDLRCSYCMPEGFKGYEEPKHWLSFDEIERLLAVFAHLGLRRVRLTGGEPLLRKNLPDLARRLAALPGIDDLSLSSNGTQLAKHAARLRRAGVTRLNVSLDSLDCARVRAICRRDVLPQVLAGLEVARNEGFPPIKINMVG